MLLKDLHEVLVSPPFIHCDNPYAIPLSLNPVQHSQIKHLEANVHFVQEHVQKGDLVVQYIPTQDQVADVFTKGLHGPDFLLGYPS